MACFAVPLAEAVVTTVVRKVIEKKEKAPKKADSAPDSHLSGISSGLPFSRKLKWLSNLLWGGSVLLAFEHVWHGEVVPWFPFLTAMSNPEDAAEMFHEMATVGVCMAALVTLVWLGMLGVSALLEKRALKAEPAET